MTQAIGNGESSILIKLIKDYSLQKEIAIWDGL